MADQFRTEKDSMGEMKVPADAYYGAQTMLPACTAQALQARGVQTPEVHTRARLLLLVLP